MLRLVEGPLRNARRSCSLGAWAASRGALGKDAGARASGGAMPCQPREHQHHPAIRPPARRDEPGPGRPDIDLRWEQTGILPRSASRENASTGLLRGSFRLLGENCGQLNAELARTRMKERLILLSERQS